MAKYLLDSGDPDEYTKISAFAKDHGEELWGGTTNPSLIAKKLAGKKITTKEAFELQKEIVFAILKIVPGAVSAEVYADATTTAEDMIEQGREIATWDERIYVKLPTTLEGLKARTTLRRENIAINNTLVFSLPQIFAICMHEKILQEVEHVGIGKWPTFISPFVGRLDDRGEDGMNLIEQAMEMKKHHNFSPWILESSIRNIVHMMRGTNANVDIFTAPGKIYDEWFALPKEERDAELINNDLKPIPVWTPTDDLLNITSIDELFKAIEENKLDISHPLTTSGIEKFASDWKSIIV